MATPTLSTEINHEVPYRLESIARAATPTDCEGTWYRYVIAQGKNLITGLRSGAESEVDFLVRDMVDRLNERRMGKNRPRTKPAQK